MDKSKPEGDACREDGTLKDASELDWPDSPTEYNRAIIEDQFRNNGSEHTPTDEPDSNNLDSESMPKPQTTKKAPKKHLRQKLDTSSDDSDDLDSNGGDETDGSPEREEASSQPQVSDMFCYIWAPVDMATKGTKAENYRQHLKDVTKDLRICGTDGKGSHPVKNTSVEGWYCKFCL